VNGRSLPSSATTVDQSLPRAHSFERLADVYHQFLSEQSLSALLERIADTLSELVPYDSLTIYEANEAKRVLTPVLARDAFEQAVMDASLRFGEGITGWAVENRIAELANRAHLHPRVSFVPNTPLEPEALITIPLIARDHVKGALNIYRLGESFFDDQEFALAKRFADAAALAIDNAHIRDSLEHQAQTDHLTGLYNHRFFHERLRSEITRASRAHDTVALLMFAGMRLVTRSSVRWPMCCARRLEALTSPAGSAARSLPWFSRHVMQGMLRGLRVASGTVCRFSTSSRQDRSRCRSVSPKGPTTL
jgi:GAF domain-containing protein